MSSLAAPLTSSGYRPVPGWLLAVMLLAAATVMGVASGALARVFFILGCGILGWHVWKQGAASHLQMLLCLFCFAPFVRRVIDLMAGYDATGIMLVGPLMAMIVPALGLWKQIMSGHRFANVQIVPVAIVAVCTLYAGMLTLAQWDITNAASGLIKGIAPLVYVSALLLRDEPMDELLEAAASAFLWILPVLGLYGIYQYVDPPLWDQFWMKSATILSAGQPVPFGVRTFSMMNSPGAFATFAGIGLMLVLFLRNGPLALILTTPCAVAFLLSSYRTAWISCAAVICFCLFFKATRGRAISAIVASIGMIILALFTPFSDVITDRFASFTEGSNDGSARERLDQFVSLWEMPMSQLVGIGYASVDVGVAGVMAVDGLFISCWLSMGLVVGLICVLALFLACGNAIISAFAIGTRNAILVGALALGAIVHFPLANIVSGEAGFLFWTFIVLLARPQSALQRRTR